MSKTKTIDRGDGAIILPKQTHVYQLDKSNGKITKAELIETGKNRYKLIEFDGCIYLPAQSMEIAEATFATIFKAAKEGNVKLSWREFIAKWLTVLTIKWNRLCKRLHI